MKPMFLSRARLKPDRSTAALGPLLVTRQRLAPHAGKALVWSLFADSGDRKRDFLWRWDSERPGGLAGEFLMLSARPPVDLHNLFDLETRKFAPALGQGDRLDFRLRANPVVRQRTKGRSRSTKHDVVMSDLRQHPKEERIDLREDLVARSGQAWMKRQLAKAGAELAADRLRVDAYQKHRVASDGSAAIEFSSLDFDGSLIVTDCDRFLSSLAHGFGAAKAYGFGLMLIKRA